MYTTVRKSKSLDNIIYNGTNLLMGVTSRAGIRNDAGAVRQTDQPQPPWSPVVLLALAALLNYLDRLLIASMHTGIVRDVPMSESGFGLLTSIFLWIYGFSSPAAGLAADRFGRSRMIVISMLVWSVATGATGFARTYDQLFACRALMGVSESLYLPAALALITDLHPGSTQSRAISIHGLGLYIGAALGGLGGVLSDALGWRAAFLLLGAVGTIYAIVLAFVLPEPGAGSTTRPAMKGNKVETTVRRFAQVSFLAVLVVGGLLSIANWLAYTWLPTFLKEAFRLTDGASGLSASGVLQGASIVGILGGGWLADRWAARSGSARSGVLALGLLLCAPALMIVAGSLTLSVVIGGIAIFGIGRGLFDATVMPVLRSIVGGPNAATAYGLFNFVGCILGGLATFAGGWLRDNGASLASAYQMAGVALLGAATLAWLARPAVPQPQEPT